MVLLSGSFSAEFDLTHVGVIDVPGKKHNADFPDHLMKDILPKMSIQHYVIPLSVFTSVALHGKTVSLL